MARIVTIEHVNFQDLTSSAAIDVSFDDSMATLSVLGLDITTVKSFSNEASF